MKKSNIFKGILYAIQGAIVGIGAILPGVSGGVLCVAFGIYEPMMELLTHPKKSFGKYYKMFIPFIIGWVLGFIFLAKGVQLLFDFSPEIALMLFFGLICGTIPELFKSSEKSNPTKSWTPFVLSLALAYLLFHLLENGVTIAIGPSFTGYIMVGAVWGLSLIIPGLSSSSVLIFLGLYEPLTAGIGALDFSVILPCVLGIVGTVLLFARLVSKMFNKHYTIVSRIILGFVIASSLKILPASFSNTITFIVSLVCFVAGFVIARSMDCVQKKKDEDVNSIKDINR